MFFMNRQILLGKVSARCCKEEKEYKERALKRRTTPKITLNKKNPKVLIQPKETRTNRNTMIQAQQHHTKTGRPPKNSKTT